MARHRKPGEKMPGSSGKKHAKKMKKKRRPRDDRFSHPGDRVTGSQGELQGKPETRGSSHGRRDGWSF